MPDRIPPPPGAVLRFFRFAKGVSVEAFAKIAGVATSTASRWEYGDLPLSRDELVALLEKHLDVPPEAVDEALFAHRLGNLPAEPIGLAGPERRLIDRAAAAGGRAGAEAARRELARERLRQRAAGDVAWAGEAWSRLMRLPAGLQDTALQALQGGERSWALAVRLCAASEAAAAHDVKEALRLARHAVSLAQAVAEPEKWRLRLLGYCEPFAANALRVGGNLAAAREAFARADALWGQGEGGDPPGLLDGTRRLDLKASLLRQDGKFAEALELLDQALAGSPPEAAVRLLIKQATTHSRAGDYETAIGVLREAAPRIDAQREPRLPFLYNFTLAVNYCHLDDFKHAEPLLPLVEALAADLRTRLDGIRVLWLRGRTWAGLGRKEEAVAALTQVRQVFLGEQIAYDFALVSLELATLYLEQGRTRQVKGLAEELLWIFEGQRVHQEALAALALFRHTAQAEEAQVEWTRRLVKYLYQAQHNPSLQFDA